MPTLTMLQSDSLSDKHWANIFNINGLPLKPYHDIKLIDVLKHAGKLAENSNEIKALKFASLKLFTHGDSKGETIMLIKDFQKRRSIRRQSVFATVS